MEEVQSQGQQSTETSASKSADSIRALNEKIEKESAFVDALSLEMDKKSLKFI